MVVPAIAGGSEGWWVGGDVAMSDAVDLCKT